MEKKSILGNEYGVGKPSFSKNSVAYFLPKKDLNINTSIKIDNSKAGYQTSPFGDSPTVYILNYFEKQIKPGEIVCSPQLAYVKNDSIIKTDITVDEKTLEVKHLFDSEVLIKSGPYLFTSYYGSGMCGSCPRAALDLVHIDLKNNQYKKSYSYLTIVDFYQDIDFKIHTNYENIKSYFTNNGNDDLSQIKWESTTCRFNKETKIFDECLYNRVDVPPNPRTFTLPK